MYLFILESIGTQELILIAGVALIIFGPRKLPQIAKTIGKTMNEFRKATSDFKSTWEKEVSFEEESATTKNPIIPHSVPGILPKPVTDSPVEVENSISEPPAPEIKQLSSEEAARIFQNVENQGQPSTAELDETPPPPATKKDWL